MIIKKNYKLNNYKDYIPDQFQPYFNDEFIILDIETTGFSRKKAQIILVGLLIKTNKEYYSQQIFCENLHEEKKLLNHLVSLLKTTPHKFLITYNGNSFDLPFINTKLKQHNINYRLSKCKSFDLYRLIQSNKNKFNLKRYNLKSIESFLDINRQDTISGKESIQLYYKYLKTRKKSLLEKILLHNDEDIRYLMPLLKILKFFSINEFLKFFPKKINSNLFIEKISHKKNYLNVIIDNLSKNEYTYYSEYYSLTSTAENKINFKIELKDTIISDNKYYLIYPNLVYNNAFLELSSSQKNSLIAVINTSIQYDNILAILKLFFKNKSFS